MKHILCLALSLCLHFYGLAQPMKPAATRAALAPLTIGSPMNYITVGNLVNSDKTVLNLSAYKNKTLIIHFLMTTCASCLASASKYDSLTAMYGGRLQFIIVTRETMEKAKKFMARRPEAFGKTPVVVADTRLEQLFPYEWVSHVVWVNPKGIVAAITDAQYVSGAHIDLVARGTIPTWPVKRDVVSFNKQAPLLRTNSDNIPFESNASNMGYSVLFNNMPNMQVSVFEGVDAVLGRQRSTYLTHSVPELYMRALDLKRFPKSQIIIKAPQPNHYFYDVDHYYKAGWEQYNTYSYEAVFPFSVGKEAMQQKMVADLDFNLGTRAYLKDTIVDGFVLQPNGNAGLPLEDQRPANTGWIRLSSIAYHLNERYNSPAVENKLAGMGDKYMPFDTGMLQDLPGLRQRLTEYGVALEPAKVSIKALVIQQENDFRFTHSPKIYAK